MTPDMSRNPDVTHCEDAVWQEIDPWGSAPMIASKLPGLGGNEPSPDPAFVFETAFFTVAPGPFRMRIMIEGAARSDAAFLLQISNRSDFEGSSPVRLMLTIATLNAFANANGIFEVAAEAKPNVQYALSAFLHADDDLHITSLRVFVDRPFDLTMDAGGRSDQVSEGARAASPVAMPVRGVSRMLGSGSPNFTNPYSQPWTPSQQREPAYLARCDELGLDAAVPESWSEAFVLQALLKYGALSAARRGIGFDCGGQALPRSLLSTGADILMTRFDSLGAEADLGAELLALQAEIPVPAHDALRFTTLIPGGLPVGYYGAFDFGWWIAPPDICMSGIADQLGGVTAALTSGGIAVLVLPFHPGKMVSVMVKDYHQNITRSGIERIALEIIAQGHNVAQLRFGSSYDMPEASQFGLIIARS